MKTRLMYGTALRSGPQNPFLLDSIFGDQLMDTSHSVYQKPVTPKKRHERLLMAITWPKSESKT
jgi:hypothetical protein